jgi:hypothetical protein
MEQTPEDKKVLQSEGTGLQDEKDLKTNEILMDQIIHRRFLPLFHLLLSIWHLKLEKGLLILVNY